MITGGIVVPSARIVSMSVIDLLFSGLAVYSGYIILKSLL
jgi:hypothetical protein